MCPRRNHEFYHLISELILFCRFFFISSPVISSHLHNFSLPLCFSHSLTPPSFSFSPYSEYLALFCPGPFIPLYFSHTSFFSYNIRKCLALQKIWSLKPFVVISVDYVWCNKFWLVMTLSLRSESLQMIFTDTLTFCIFVDE